MANQYSSKNWGLVRIDDRLLHGQVLAVWIRSRRFTKIQIADDDLAADPFMVDVMRLSAPPGLVVNAESIENSVVSLNSEPNPQTTMILLKSPAAAFRLFESGIFFSSLNIGGIGIGPGRKNVFQNTSLSKEEFEILKLLNLRGVKITFLSVPGEKSKEFLELSDIW